MNYNRIKYIYIPVKEAYLVDTKYGPKIKIIFHAYEKLDEMWMNPKQVFPQGGTYNHIKKREEDQTIKMFLSYALWLEENKEFDFHHMVEAYEDIYGEYHVVL